VDRETLDNFYLALDNPVKKTAKFQMFKTVIDNNDIGKSMKRHKLEIVASMIFSKQSEYKSFFDSHGLYSMSGFREQEDRLPNKNDKVKVIRGKYYLDKFGGHIVSEIGFEIIRGSTI